MKPRYARVRITCSDCGNELTNQGNIYACETCWVAWNPGTPEDGAAAIVWFDVDGEEHTFKDTTNV